MLLSTFLQEYFDYFKVSKSYFINCSADSRVVSFFIFDSNDTNLGTINVYVSKDINKVLNRANGYDLNKSSNNGVCLVQENIDYYVYYDTYNRTYKLF